jgi:predicted kinase
MQYSSILTVASHTLDKIDVSEKPIVVMGIGIPASGKSTILQEVAWQAGPNVRPIDVNAIRNRLVRLNARGSLLEFLDREMYKQTDDNLVSRGIALIDGMNLEAEKRFVDIGRYRDLGAVTVGALFMDIDKETAVEWNRAREVPVTSAYIGQMESLLHENKPNLDEGFDWIITVGQQGVHTLESREDTNY